MTYIQNDENKHCFGKPLRTWGRGGWRPRATSQSLAAPASWPGAGTQSVCRRTQPPTERLLAPEGMADLRCPAWRGVPSPPILSFACMAVGSRRCGGTSPSCHDAVAAGWAGDLRGQGRARLPLRSAGWLWGQEDSPRGSHLPALPVRSLCRALRTRTPSAGG